MHTFVDAGAEAALEAAAAVDELHVGTHVGLAAVAADGSRLSVVHHEQRSLGGGSTAEHTGLSGSPYGGLHL